MERTGRVSALEDVKAFTSYTVYVYGVKVAETEIMGH